MAETVVVQPAGQDNGAMTMVFGAIIVLALIIGGIYLYRHSGANGAAAAPGANINVTLPTGSGDSGGATQ